MEEGRILAGKRKEQIIYLNPSSYPFLKDLKLGDRGYIKTSGEVISERAQDNDVISKLVRLKEITVMEGSRRII